MKSKRYLLLMTVIVLTGHSAVRCAADKSPQTRPATEKRFPPLVVPPGFKATLFACDPMIEYPSAISIGPRPGAVFVAVDYMTGLGLDIVRRSEVRLVEDTDGDGYADKATVYADGLNSIMGLAYHDGTLYVMHSPFLTALRDTKAAGVAAERTDLLVGLGLPPEDNPERLHCANGVTVGHDGWLYLALGDHGCDVKRPEGDRLILEGGGILRCRPDGRDLHIFATGLRNIYDVALDAELNVVVRDNENDGGVYKVRVCHSFFGADHGYPYLYYERPAEALRPLADLGLGSSPGGACYLERHFPQEYRGNAMFCEWGKSLVRYPLRREGSSFASPQEIEFAEGGEGDPYGFQPTDVVVQRDGTLMVSDYADGQRPKRGRGRIYHIAYVGGAKLQLPQLPSSPFAMLDSESYFERCEAQTAIESRREGGLEQLTESLTAGRIGALGRLHAIWILVHVRGAHAIEPLLAIASSDPEPSVRAQAVRAIANLADPVLARHRLDAGPGDMELATRLAALGEQDRRVVLEIIVALSRLRWPGTAGWLNENLAQPDEALSHAAMQALRQSGNWPAVLKLLDAPESDPLRATALRAAARQYDAQLVDGLLKRMSRETDADRLCEYADWLARVHKKPGTWVYWGWRPKPRPPNQVSWERTERIADVLNRLLSHRDRDLRLTVLRHMRREQVPTRLEALGNWLSDESDPKRVAALLDVMRDQPVADVHQYLKLVIRNPTQTSSNRLTALDLFAGGIGNEHTDALLAQSEELEDGPVLAETLRLLRKYPSLPAVPLLARKLGSANPEVRAAAIETLGELRAVEAREPLVRLLADHDPRVRRAAANVAGKLEERQAIEPLLQLATDNEPLVRAASLDSLRLLKEPRAVPLSVAALADRHTEQIALECLSALGGPEQACAVAALAKRSPSLDVLTTAVQVLTSWRERPKATAAQQQELDRAVAEIHGSSGSLVRWHVSGPTGISHDANAIANAEPTNSHTRFAAGTEGRIVISADGAEKGSRFLARTDIAVSGETDVEFLASSSGGLQIFLNGTSIYRRETPQEFRIDSDRVPAMLPEGNNQLVVVTEVAAPESPVEFHLRFRRKSTVAHHERLAAAALAQSGDPERGQDVFSNVEKSLCLKCHRLNDQGEQIGPELTGVGSRFSRIHIVESILEPSHTIAPSFGTLVVTLESGQVLSGTKVAEDEIMLTLADNQGQRQLVPKDAIDDQYSSEISTMPEGLEKRLSDEEFVDLVAFLASLLEGPVP